MSVCDSAMRNVQEKWTELQTLQEELAAAPGDPGLQSDVDSASKTLDKASLLLADCEKRTFAERIVAIRSVQFPDVSLRIDGSNLTQFAASGGGTINGQFGPPGSFERIRLLTDGTAQNPQVMIGSTQFANVFLRMDGTGVSEFAASGSGTVNCQFGALEFEQFIMVSVAEGIVAFEALQFPKTYLRLDGTGATSSKDSGVGIVNCQFGEPGPFERFRLVPVP